MAYYVTGTQTTAMDIGNLSANLQGNFTSLDSLNARGITGKPTGTISISDFRQKAPVVASEYITQGVVQQIYTNSNNRVSGVSNELVKCFLDASGITYTVVGAINTTLAERTAVGINCLSLDSASSNAYQQRIITQGNTNPDCEIMRWVIPSWCTSIYIEAWGGGGGSGGRSSGGVGNGYGGAGGYARTTLAVNTDFVPGQILHTFVGPGGAGGWSQWHSGTGGFASAVYITSGAFGQPANFTSAGTDWSALQTLLNTSSCVLIAGGGGGGGACNSSSYAGGAGGSGGHTESGGAGWHGGYGTGATTTAHGGGAITPLIGVYAGNFGGGVVFSTLSSTAASLATIQEATLLALHPYGVSYFGNQADRDAGFFINTVRSGGGGAFQGNCGAVNVATGVSADRGGGGGANKVYRGTGQYVENSGISLSPPQFTNAAGAATGGGFAGVTNTSNGGWYGISGTPGKILMTFN